MSQRKEVEKVPGPEDIMLKTRKEIERVKRRLARQLIKDYRGQNPVFIAIHKGGSMVLADITRYMNGYGFEEFDYDFIPAASYGLLTKSSGHVNISAGLEIDIEGRPCVVFDDISDTNRTFVAIDAEIRKRNPTSIEYLALFNKPDPEKQPFRIKYLGMDIPIFFVFGARSLDRPPFRGRAAPDLWYTPPAKED